MVVDAFQVWPGTEHGASSNHLMGYKNTSFLATAVLLSAM